MMKYKSCVIIICRSFKICKLTSIMLFEKKISFPKLVGLFKSTTTRNDDHRCSYSNWDQRFSVISEDRAGTTLWLGNLAVGCFYGLKTRSWNM